MKPTIQNAGRLAGVLATFLLTGVAAHVSARTPDPTPPPAPQVTPLNRAVRSPGNAEWAGSLAAARETAAAQKKLVYQEFESPDCGECRRMQALLYPAMDFEALLIGTVPVKLQLDSSEAKPVQERYGITRAPAVLITSPEGRIVFMMQGFKEAPEFFGRARKGIDDYRAFVKKVAAQDVATLSAADAYSTGRELYARSDPQAALPRLRRAAAAPNPGPGIRESALEGLAAVELELGQTAESRKTIDRLIATTKSPEQKERAELFRAQIPLAEGKPEAALALYRQFAKDHPSSQYIGRVQEFIARLESGASQ